MRNKEKWFINWNKGKGDNPDNNKINELSKRINEMIADVRNDYLFVQKEAVWNGKPVRQVKEYTQADLWNSARMRLSDHLEDLEDLKYIIQN